MSAIPDDIKQAATRIADRYLSFDISCQRLYDDVSAALLAEREAATVRERARCAQIAEECSLGPNALWSEQEAQWWETGHSDAQLAIADHIRDPHYVNLLADKDRGEE